MRTLVWFALAGLVAGCAAVAQPTPDASWCGGAYDAKRGTNFAGCTIRTEIEIQTPGDVSAPTE